MPLNQQLGPYFENETCVYANLFINAIKVFPKPVGLWKQFHKTEIEHLFLTDYNFLEYQATPLSPPHMTGLYLHAQYQGCPAAQTEHSPCLLHWSLEMLLHISEKIKACYLSIKMKMNFYLNLLFQNCIHSKKVTEFIALGLLAPLY